MLFIRRGHRRAYLLSCLLLLALILSAALSLYQPARATEEDQSASQAESSSSHQLYLPLTVDRSPWISPFGVETNTVFFSSQTLLNQASDLQISWTRMNARISWRELQPNPGDPIQWHLLTDFETELRNLKSRGINPVVIVDDAPRWATIRESSCSAIRPERFHDFAQFMRALVARYKVPEFNVKNWELGNEPDVDPGLVPPDSVFGCWGDINDEFYGGRHYGEMLKVVTPAIKAEDPSAQVWIGGLLLDRPHTTTPGRGTPERFLEGILVTGAAPYFDVVPYHVYPPYQNRRIDHDNAIGSPWDALGGGVVGKARFLRDTMARYGVDKPLVLNETGFMCPEYYQWCRPHPQSFYQMQADWTVRTFVRALSANVKGIFWYTLEGPGWRGSSLLFDKEGTSKKPSYTAYQQLVDQLKYAYYKGSVTYKAGVEAYSFDRKRVRVDVLWAINDEVISIEVPYSSFLAAYTRDGTRITPSLVGSNYVLHVGFEPVYIHRRP